MEACEAFAAICEALADPAFYPHPVARLERRDTHISTVFLTGDFAYKLKKPVAFGFLDFSDRASREFYCRREVELNRRLSRGVYLGVEALCRTPDGRLGWGRNGEVLDHLVKMRQLPDAASLLVKVRDATVTTADMNRLGRTLADFYRAGDGPPELRSYGDPDLIAAHVEDNFRQTEPFLDHILNRERWTFIAQVSRSFLLHQQRLLRQRQAEGWIRDGHGDLRPDHVYFHDGLQIIDCIEFNDRFRYGDVAADLAFLFMDLDRMGGGERGLEALAAYVAAAADPDLYRLLDFYACYRAMVRVKVDCLRSAQADAAPGVAERAGSYLEQAYRHAVQCARPTLWLVGGLPASGKTTVAAALARSLAIAHVQSDALRRELIASGGPLAGVTGYGEGIYQPRWKRQVYRRMLERAADELRALRSVVLDATFAEAKWREEALRLAADHDSNRILVECLAAPSTLEARLRLREHAGILSDARIRHFSQFQRDFEAITEVPPDTHLRVTTEQPQEALWRDLVSRAYRLQCLQVRSRIAA